MEPQRSARLVIEQLTGMSASEAFQQRIFGPLGLTHTSLPKNTDSSIPQPHAQGYQFGTNVATISSYAVPAAQLPGPARNSETDQHDEGQPVMGQLGSVGYGLGIARFAPNIYGHDGQIPGYSTLMVHDLKRDITIIIGTNLAASPVHGENAAVVLGKAIIITLQGQSVLQD